MSDARKKEKGVFETGVELMTALNINKLREMAERQERQAKADRTAAFLRQQELDARQHKEEMARRSAEIQQRWEERKRREEAEAEASVRESQAIADTQNRCRLTIPSEICSNDDRAQPTFELDHNYIRELIERRIHEGLVPDPAKLRAELARLPVINGFHKFNHVLCGLLGMKPEEVMPAIDHIDADINEQVGVLIKRAFALFPSLSDLKPFPVVWEWTYFESAQDFHAEAASLHFTQIMAVVFDHLEGRVLV